MRHKEIIRADVLLFPSSFTNPEKVDEDLQQEYEAALETEFCIMLLKRERGLR